MGYRDDDADDFVFRPPPAPDDRLWRHPSEYAAPTEPRSLQASGSSRSLLGSVVFAAALLGATAVGTIWYRSAPGPSQTALTQRITTTSIESVASQVSQVQQVPQADEWAAEIAFLTHSSTVVVQSAHDGRELAGAVAISSGEYLITSSRALETYSEFVVYSDHEPIIKANLVGHDPVTDLAVLKLENEIEPAFLAAHPAQPGDTIAVVDPHGLAKRHVVSNRSATSIAVNGDQLIGFGTLDGPLATTLAGSPIVDHTGAVVGITMATNPNDVITFVPIGIANRVAAFLITSGTMKHAWLGVTAIPAIEGDPGALVTVVAAEGPASHAGLVPDDLITAIGLAPITSLETMMATLRHHSPGDSVEVIVQRGRDSFSCYVQLGFTYKTNGSAESIPSNPPEPPNDKCYKTKPPEGGPDQS